MQHGEMHCRGSRTETGDCCQPTAMQAQPSVNRACMVHMQPWRHVCLPVRPTYTNTHTHTQSRTHCSGRPNPPARSNHLLRTPPRASPLTALGAVPFQPLMHFQTCKTNAMKRHNVQSSVVAIATAVVSAARAAAQATQAGRARTLATGHPWRTPGEHLAGVSCTPPHSCPRQPRFFTRGRGGCSSGPEISKTRSENGRLHWISSGTDLGVRAEQPLPFLIRVAPAAGNSGFVQGFRRPSPKVRVPDGLNCPGANRDQPSTEV